MKILKLCKLCKTFWTIFRNCIPCRKSRDRTRVKRKEIVKPKDYSNELITLILPKFYWSRKRTVDREKQRLRLVKQLKCIGKKLHWH